MPGMTKAVDSTGFTFPRGLPRAWTASTDRDYRLFLGGKRHAGIKCHFELKGGIVIDGPCEIIAYSPGRDADDEPTKVPIIKQVRPNEVAQQGFGFI